MALVDESTVVRMTRTGFTTGLTTDVQVMVAKSGKHEIKLDHKLHLSGVATKKAEVQNGSDGITYHISQFLQVI